MGKGGSMFGVWVVHALKKRVSCFEGFAINIHGHPIKRHKESWAVN